MFRRGQHHLRTEEGELLAFDAAFHRRVALDEACFARCFETPPSWCNVVGRPVESCLLHGDLKDLHWEAYSFWAGVVAKQSTMKFRGHWLVRAIDSVANLTGVWNMMFSTGMQTWYKIRPA